MRRLMLAAFGIMALALAIPGAALAHKGHGHHHKGHHHANGKAHHASVRFEHFGAIAASEKTPGTSTETGTKTSSEPTPPASENAGTVASYDSSTGLLTLSLNNKSTVEGKVTSNTEIRCVKATTTPPSGQPSDESVGDDNGQGDDQSRGDMSQQQGDQQSWSSDESQGDDQDGQDDDGQAQTAAPEPPCDTSALVSGAVVRSAELRIGPSGAEFESLVLVR